MNSPAPWLSPGRLLCLAFALCLFAAAAPGCGNDSPPPAPAGLAASVIGEWVPSAPEVDRMALELFSHLRKANPLTAPGDEKVSHLEAALAGVSVAHVEKMRAMSDPELRSYARARVEAMALRFLQGGKAESRSGFEGPSPPATWRVDGDALVLEASLDSPDEHAPKRDTPKYLVVVRFRLLEETLILEDVRLTGIDEEEDETWFPRTWQRATSRDR